jgi:hypothetical protein
LRVCSIFSLASAFMEQKESSNMIKIIFFIKTLQIKNLLHILLTKAKSCELKMKCK